MAAAIPYVIAGAATAVQANAQRKAGQAAQAQGEYEGGILDRNAGVYDLQATDAISRGAEASARQRQAVRRMTGSQRVALAAQGIDIGSGSAADVQANTAYVGELDALTIENNARREAWGFQTQATNARAQAGLARTAGRTAAASGTNAAVGTLLTGGAQIYDIYKRGKG
jgi:hypothetical protein